MIQAVGADPRIVHLPFTSPLLLVTGAPSAGKTAALVQRYVALIRRDEIAPSSTLVAAAGAPGAAALAARIEAALDPAERAAIANAPFAGITLDRLAFAIVADGALEAGLAVDLEPLEFYEVEEVFERATAQLFSADWAEYLGPDIDPEISGLRAPLRFAGAALRLIVKLRDAGIGPDEMLGFALRGAATFYAKPPNFADPGLLFATSDNYRSSLRVGPDELEHQRRREIDLAKIVAKLYRSYLEQLVRHGCLAPADALAEAVLILETQPAIAKTYRERLRLAVVDDVHDLRPGEVALLTALFGKALTGVTFAGSLSSAIQTFSGVRPDATFKLAATTIDIPGDGDVPPATAACARAILTADTTATVVAGDAVRTHRFAVRGEETAFVASAVNDLIAAGTEPGRIAVVHRTARCLVGFEDALVDAGVPVGLHGDIDLLARPEAGDALAILWATANPYKHVWLLRALQLPATGLSDATLAMLCGEPADPQAMLFPMPAEDVTGDRRWDRRRDIRLGANVVRGERDGDLDEDSRARIVAFRERRKRWVAHAREAGAGAARALLADAGLFEARRGETPARARRRTSVIESVLALIGRYVDRYPGATLLDALGLLERIAPAERGVIVRDERLDAVFTGAIDQMSPRRFDHVFVVDARAGSFPPYYVPDSFLFSPAYGMIPKDAVGETTASRTAKFTWYSHQTKLKDAYAREARRMLALAMLRADRGVVVTASGRATRGVGAPEFQSEVHAMLRTS